MNLSEFLQMSGYGAYVWSCYGLTLAVLIGIEWAGRRRLKEELIRATRRAQMAEGKS